MVEEIYLANQLAKEKGMEEDVFDEVDIVDEFSGFFFAGTDTAYIFTYADLI